MTKKNNFTIDVTERDPRWPSLDSAINKVALKTLELAGRKGPAELSIVLADDVFVQNLNHHYRNKDKPTNVLSFPADDPLLLGDVVLAYETVQKEAAAAKISLEHHVMHLIAHGILHLLGHDHENDREAEDMESLEISILRSFGVKNPYEPDDD